MHRSQLAHLALFAVLSLTVACGGAQTHAEAPAPAPSSDAVASAGAGDQVPESALPKGMADAPPPAAKPEAHSAAEEAIINGTALPDLPNTPSTPKAAKPTKAKKPPKSPKKTAQATRG